MPTLDRLTHLLLAAIEHARTVAATHHASDPLPPAVLIDYKPTHPPRLLITPTEAIERLYTDPAITPPLFYAAVNVVAKAVDWGRGLSVVGVHPCGGFLPWDDALSDEAILTTTFHLNRSGHLQAVTLVERRGRLFLPKGG